MIFSKGESLCTLAAHLDVDSLNFVMHSGEKLKGRQGRKKADAVASKVYMKLTVVAALSVTCVNTNAPVY